MYKVIQRDCLISYPKFQLYQTWRLMNEIYSQDFNLIQTSIWRPGGLYELVIGSIFRTADLPRVRYRLIRIILGSIISSCIEGGKLLKSKILLRFEKEWIFMKVNFVFNFPDAVWVTVRSSVYRQWTIETRKMRL